MNVNSCLRVAQIKSPFKDALAGGGSVQITCPLKAVSWRLSLGPSV